MPADSVCMPADSANDRVTLLAVVPPWRRTEVTWKLTPQRRGVYPLGKPALTTSFPFGLWRARRPLRVAGEMVIWPRTFPLGPLGFVPATNGCEGEIALMQAGTSGDLLGVRPYRHGDRLRRIHWAQSARHDRLITCERQRLVRLEVQIVLGTAPKAETETGPDAPREWAIRIAATLGCGLFQQGVDVTAVVGTQTMRLTGGDARRSSGGGLRGWLDLLARLNADRCPPLDELLALPAVRRFSGTWQFVVTSAEAYDCLPPPTVTVRHRRFVVVETNPAADGQPGLSIESEVARHVIRIRDPHEAPSALARGWRRMSHAR